MAGVTPEYESTGGNPGGFIKESDAGADTWYFVAPSTWSGDMSGYIGGTLSYDIIILLALQSYFSDKDVIIWGGDPSVNTSPYLSWTSGIEPPTPPGQAWTPFSVQINSGNFTLHTFAGGPTATFDSIMADVYAIHIRGEFIGANDTEGIDNVSLQAVPLPGAVWLLGSGLIAFIGMRNKLRD